MSQIYKIFACSLKHLEINIIQTETLPGIGRSLGCQQESLSLSMAIPSPELKTSNPELPRTLGPLMLWGLGVGYVISGMYFGWNLGLAAGGTAGLAIATAGAILLYITFT